MKTFNNSVIFSVALIGVLLVVGCASTSQPASYHVQQALTQFLTGQFDQAIAHLDKAIRTDPENAEAYNFRGFVYVMTGKLDRSITDLDKAIEIDPEYSEAYANRAMVYNIKGQYDQAIADCNEAIEINPENATAYTNRGVAHREKGQYDRAIADFDKVIEINPKHAETYVRRGSVYMADLNNKIRACSDWKKACELGECGKYNEAKKQGVCE